MLVASALCVGFNSCGKDDDDVVKPNTEETKDPEKSDDNEDDKGGKDDPKEEEDNSVVKFFPMFTETSQPSHFKLKEEEMISLCTWSKVGSRNVEVKVSDCTVDFGDSSMKKTSDADSQIVTYTGKYLIVQVMDGIGDATVFSIRGVKHSDKEIPLTINYTYKGVSYTKQFYVEVEVNENGTDAADDRIGDVTNVGNGQNGLTVFMNASATGLGQLLFDVYRGSSISVNLYAWVGEGDKKDLKKVAMSGVTFDACPYVIASVVDSYTINITGVQLTDGKSVPLTITYRYDGKVYKTELPITVSQDPTENGANGKVAFFISNTNSMVPNTIQMNENEVLYFEAFEKSGAKWTYHKTLSTFKCGILESGVSAEFGGEKNKYYHASDENLNISVSNKDLDGYKGTTGYILARKSTDGAFKTVYISYLVDGKSTSTYFKIRVVKK